MRRLKLFSIYCLLGTCYPSQGDLINPAHPQQPDNCKVAEILQKVTTAVAGLGEELQALNVKSANISGQIRSSLVGNLKFLGEISREAQPESSPRGRQMEVLDKVIQNPKAKLYEGSHFTGNVTNYDFNDLDNSGGGCYEPDGDWQSVDPGQSCVRLFEEDSCRGKSLALYPGSKNNENTGALLTRVWSVGPCLENEFNFATFSRTSAGILVSKSASNLRQVPDLVDYYHRNSYEATGSGEGYPGSIVLYSTESGKRIKFLHAAISKGHVKSPMSGITVSSDVTHHWNSLDKQKGDQMGLIVPTGLGGLRNETFNIFPQSPSIAREWKRVTDRVQEMFQTPCAHHGAILEVNFVYENSQGTRPYAFTYNMNLCNNAVIKNGFIPN